MASTPASASPAPASTATTASAWSPFAHRWFLWFWLAMLVSNMGLWMRDVASAWLMTSLAPSPLWVAAVQAAATLPMFVFGLPAGALADLFDRRRVLIVAQLIMAAGSLALALLAWFDAVTPASLLACTAFASIGATLAAPAWQSLVPRLVPAHELRAAVALNSTGFNVARALGPALGGAIVAAFGAAVAYGADVLSFIGVIAVLLLWRAGSDGGSASSAPRENLAGAMRAGLRYAAHSPALRSVLKRGAALFTFASAYWALLPLVARQSLGGGPTLYGVLLGAAGAGALLGAVLLPALRARLSGDGMYRLALGATATALGALALAPNAVVAAGAMLLAGAAWIVALTTLNVATQSALPDWVRARGLALYLMVFNGAMAAGSLLWGQVAGWTGVPWALGTAAMVMVMVLGVAWVRRWQEPADDLRTAPAWPDPYTATPINDDRGPVLICIEYRVEAAQRPALLAALRTQSAARRRDGAYDWQLFEDTAEPERVIEQFLVASWQEHLRQHHRVTVTDNALRAAIATLVKPGTAPQVSHALAIG